MENEFECIKLKDGLYLGNSITAQDYQFLQINKFAFIINCSAEIPNYFDGHGIKYLKFKLIKQKAHKLWSQNLKKLRKMQKFIEECQQNSLCCLIFSATGNNRSLVMITSYLMSRYRWKVAKTLQYIRSKQIYIGLSEHYINQLEILEEMLNQEIDKPKLSSNWGGPYCDQEQEIISKTFINSQDITPFKEENVKEKQKKRVMWLDKIQKEKKKEKESKNKHTIEDFNQGTLGRKKKINSTKNLQTQYFNPSTSVSTKLIKKQLSEDPFRKQQTKKSIGKKPIKNSSLNNKARNLKSIEEESDDEDINGKTKNTQNITKIQKLNLERFQLEQVPIPQQNNFVNNNESNSNQDDVTTGHPIFDEKELLKIIKQNLQLKNEDISKNQDMEQENNSGRSDHQVTSKGKIAKQPKEIYRLTINNFIQPNINFMNPLLQDKVNNNSQKVVFASKNINKNKINVSKDEKQCKVQSDFNNKSANDIAKVKIEKANKNYKRNTENSPKIRERKLDKAVSLQFKKNT